jgi:hypothetical protein
MPRSGDTVRTKRVQRTTSGSWLRWRWLLLCPFVVGYLLTNPVLEGDSGYLWATLATIASCAILLSRLDRSLDITLPFWTIFAVFLVGYYIKFYWVVLDPNFLKEAGELIALAYSPTALLPAFNLATTAFVSFCLTAWVLLGLTGRREVPNGAETHVEAYRSVARFLVWLTPALMLFTFWIAYETGILIMGAASVNLPFRLAGMIFYARSTLIPALILMLIYCGNKADERVRTSIGIALLFIHGLSDVLLRSSRGQFVVMVFALGALLLVSGKVLRRSALSILLVGVLITSMLAPVITEYRNYRALSPEASIAEALIGGVQSESVAEVSFTELFTSGFRFVAMRVVGMEMLLVYMGYHVMPLGDSALAVMQSPRGFAGYVTMDLLGVPEYVSTSAAVSLVGWFYLVGGTISVVVGILGYLVLVWALWSGLRRLRLRILPVAQAILLVWVYTVTSEGTLDAQFLPLMATLASIVVCEWLVRWFEHSRKVTRHLPTLESGSSS